MRTTKKYLTISVDDGHSTDLRSADLLAKFNFKATFYIPKTNPERKVMEEQQIRQISRCFDVGGHTVSHVSLKRMSDAQAFAEISEGKKWLEDLVGSEVLAFCYPQGKFNSRTPGLVKKAGFKGARTCMMNLNCFPLNPYLWGLSTQGCSHSMRIQFQHALIEWNLEGALNYAKTYRLARDWAQHFRNALDYVDQNGGVAHLYFHSWEIEKQREWTKLEEILSEASSRKDLLRVTNGELFNLWYAIGEYDQSHKK